MHSIGAVAAAFAGVSSLSSESPVWLSISALSLACLSTLLVLSSKTRYGLVGLLLIWVLGTALITLELVLSQGQGHATLLLIPQALLLALPFRLLPQPTWLPLRRFATGLAIVLAGVVLVGDPQMALRVSLETRLQDSIFRGHQVLPGSITWLIVCPTKQATLSARQGDQLLVLEPLHDYTPDAPPQPGPCRMARLNTRLETTDAVEVSARGPGIVRRTVVTFRVVGKPQEGRGVNALGRAGRITLRLTVPLTAEAVSLAVIPPPQVGTSSFVLGKTAEVSADRTTVSVPYALRNCALQALRLRVYGSEELTLEEVPFSLPAQSCTGNILVQPRAYIERNEDGYPNLLVDLSHTPSALQGNIQALATDGRNVEQGWQPVDYGPEGRAWDLSYAPDMGFNFKNACQIEAMTVTAWRSPQVPLGWTDPLHPPPDAIRLTAMPVS